MSEDWLLCATDIEVPLSVAYEFQELLEARLSLPWAQKLPYLLNSRQNLCQKSSELGFG